MDHANTEGFPSLPGLVFCACSRVTHLIECSAEDQSHVTCIISLINIQPMTTDEDLLLYCKESFSASLLVIL
jgi:hypothetical protein